MWKNVLFKGLAAVLVLGALFLVSFITKEHGQQKVMDFKVDVNTFKADNFLSAEEIKEIIKSKVDTLIGRPVEKIRLIDIESVIEREPSVKNAEAFLGVNGVVHLNVDLKKVVVRIKPDSSKGIYIDSEGGVMEWVPNYTPRVAMVYGFVEGYDKSVHDSLRADLINHKKLIADMFELVSHMKKSEFLSSQFTNIYIAANGDVQLIPLVGDQTIELGSVSDLENKFKKLELFYNKIVKVKGWQTYKKVSLKFNNQIVCTKS